MKRGKKYQDAVKKIEKGKLYSIQEASELVKTLSYAKFDESLELHVKLSLKKSQSVRPAAADVTIKLWTQYLK